MPAKVHDNYIKVHAHWSDAQDAAHQVVHGFKYLGRRGGAAICKKVNDLTERLPTLNKTNAAAAKALVNKRHSIINSEVNPEQPHKLSYENAIHYSVITRDYTMLKVFAAECSHAVVPLPEQSTYSDEQALKAFSQWQAALGVTNQTIHTALADGVINKRELADIKASAYSHISQFFIFLDVLEKMELKNGK